MSSEHQLLPQYQLEENQDYPEWLWNEAHLIKEALDDGVISLMEAEEGLDTPAHIARMMHDMIDLTFFVEFPPENVPPEERGEALKEMFWQSVTGTVEGEEVTLPLFEYLRRTGRGVSLTMSTLDESTAGAIALLNDHEVPVTGWIVVDDEDGYWTNQSNITKTADRTREVMDWIEENNLQVHTLGFDLEKPLHYLKALANVKLTSLLSEISLYRALKKESRYLHGKPQELLEEMLDEVRERGFETEVYSMPRLMKRILADMSVPAGVREIEMTYTSDMPAIARRRGWALRRIWSKDTIPALGIVSGKDDETPGRALREGGPGHHLTQTELTQHFEALLGRSSSLAQRELGLRAVYLFALNDATVATMTDNAIFDAFESIHR